MTTTLRIAALLALLAVHGCSPSQDGTGASSGGDTASVPSDEQPAATDSTIHFTGLGPLRAGMTLAEAEQALGAPLALLGPKMDPCYYVTDARRSGVAFMVIEDRIARIDVREPSGVKTANGAGVGDSEDRIRTLYPGPIEVQPHKYVDGHYLIVRPAAPADTNYRIIFETDGTRVTSYRAGRMPEVRWVEGCS